MTLLKLCTVCGEPSTTNRCDDHKPEPQPKESATSRGYDYRWSKLSERARKLQPWCSVCGTKEDLTGDHLRWPARTLADVDVLCRPCNSARGAARGVTLASSSRDHRGKADMPTVGEPSSRGHS